MNITVNDISNYINEIAPYNTKCDWDNCGILVGDKNAIVKKIGLCLDLTSQTLSEAKKNGVDLIITHHPVIFTPKKNFLSGDVVFAAAQKNINIISAHTCFDCASNGVNDYLCKILNIKDVQGVESQECAVPMARIGIVDTIMPKDLAKFVSQKLDATVCLVDCNKPIKRVAVCGGAGMSFFDDILRKKADAYITGEIRHHEMLLAKESEITVISAGHFETEYITMNSLKEMLREKFSFPEILLLFQEKPAIYIN